MRIDLPKHWTGPPVVDGCQDLRPVLAALVAEATEEQPWRSAAVRGGLLALVAGLARRLESEPIRRLNAAQQEALQRHADADLAATPRDLARVLGLTHDYASRLIHATWGRSPRRWLVERRVQAAAADLIESAAAIAVIAARHGWADERRFGRQFRRICGMPPGRFRLQHGDT